MTGTDRKLFRQAILAIQQLQAALDSTMPGVRYIAVQNYAALNTAPLNGVHVIDRINKRLRNTK